MLVEVYKSVIVPEEAAPTPGRIFDEIVRLMTTGGNSLLPHTTLTLSGDETGERGEVSRRGRTAAISTIAELAIVIPTLNEAANVALLTKRLARALEGIAWEVIFVDDDSRDGIEQVICHHGHHRVELEIPRRGTPRDRGVIADHLRADHQ